MALTQDNTPHAKKASKKIREKAVELGAQLLRGAAKVGVKAAVRTATAGIVDSDDVKKIVEDVVSEAGDTAEDYMKELLDNPRKQQETVISFRRALEELPALLAPPSEDGDQKPLVFIIDELDRCKPLFALEILERIKHFMSVRNMHFVLGTNLRQLEASVRYAYGSDIDARSYLQKFIMVTILNERSEYKRREDDLVKYATHLAKNLALPQNRESPVDASTDTIIRLVRRHEMSFRTIERAFTILALSLAFTPENYLKLGPAMGGLIMMKVLEPSLFQKAKRGTLTLAEAEKFLCFIPDKNEGDKGWEEKWWNYLLGEEVTEDLKEWGKSLGFRYSFRDRREIVQYMASNVIDRLSLN